MEFRTLLRKNIVIYWQTIFIIMYPLCLLPMFLISTTPAMRCFYLATVMAGFWVTEVIPVTVTAMFPIAFFPTMGILDAKETSMSYLKEANMVFVGGLIIALAVEYCNLHLRLALMAIRFTGCNYRRLNLLFVTVTMLISMWISNTVVTAVMIPIINTVLTELEAQGLGRRWQLTETEEELEEVIVIEEKQEEEEVEVVEIPKVKKVKKKAPTDRTQRRSTSLSMCFYVSTAYAAGIGGLGCTLGSSTNFVLKGAYEEEFPDSPGMEFHRWLALNTTIMLVIMYLSWLWLQFWYMGLWRPNSHDAQDINISHEGKEIIQKILAEKLTNLGPMSAHEILVVLMVCLACILWLFREPGFIRGWPSFLSTFEVGDSTAAFIVVALLFILPAKLDFIHMFNEDENLRPKKTSIGLISWNFVVEKMFWGLIFLPGGGYALSDGIYSSGMRINLSEYLSRLSLYTPRMIIILSCLMASFITQFVNNEAAADILLPIVANIARAAKIHPMYLMMPVGLSCSFAFCLPVSTPPNAITSTFNNIRSGDMIKAGWMLQIISFVTVILIFPSLGSLLWDFSEFPQWAYHNDTKNLTVNLRLW